MASSDHNHADDSDYDSYLSKTYVPLSNLPTPPNSSHSYDGTRQYGPALEVDESLDPDLLGPAIHLSNLVPTAASLIDPSVHRVHTLLCHAELPRPVLALACCILDSLNSRFALTWRNSCPLNKTYSPDSPDEEMDINSIRQEVIVLSAIIISVKFLDDKDCTTQIYAEEWGSRQWTCDQINATQECILKNLGYRILPLWTTELIGDALKDMEKAGALARAAMAENVLKVKGTNPARLSPGESIWTAQEQLTPVETPTSKNTPIAKGSSSNGHLALGPKSQWDVEGLAH